MKSHLDSIKGKIMEEQIKSLREKLSQKIDQTSDRLVEICTRIHQNPEICFQELQSAELLIQELEKHGFEAERNTADC